jgi:ribonuclease HIII
MTETNSFVAQIDLKLADQLLKDLKDQGFEISKPPYTLFAGKKTGVSCTLYTSGKIVVQGKGKGEFLEFYLEPQILKKFEYSYGAAVDSDVDPTPRIGIDESGKGDFFGPLCIAGVYASSENMHKLKELGVKDSKLINDKGIFELASKIKREFQHHIVRINPHRYNELIVQFKNLNKLLAWGHATTIENLVETTGCQKVIIDQFADESVVLTALKRKKLALDLTQRHKGEADLVVAAASILAREAFLSGLKKLQDEYGVKFPKGASSQVISVGREFLRDFGQEGFSKVAKVHFKTLDSILRRNQNGSHE